MTCTPFKGDGFSGIICSRGRPAPEKCSCGRPATKLCDFPRQVPLIRGGRQSMVQKTCDAPLCDHCAVSVGPARDHCREHP